MRREGSRESKKLRAEIKRGLTVNFKNDPLRGEDPFIVLSAGIKRAKKSKKLIQARKWKITFSSLRLWAQGKDCADHSRQKPLFLLYGTAMEDNNTASNLLYTSFTFYPNLLNSY